MRKQTAIEAGREDPPARSPGLDPDGAEQANPVQDQAVERACLTTESPAEVRGAAATDDDGPAIAGEPGVLEGVGGDGRDPRGDREAADVEVPAVGIGEGVFVGPSHGDDGVFRRDWRVTGGAVVPTHEAPLQRFGVVLQDAILAVFVEHASPSKRKRRLELLQAAASPLSDWVVLVAVTATTSATATLTRLADVDPTTVELSSIHLLDGGVGITRIRERHETETAAAARLTVGDDLCVENLTEGLKGLPKSLVVGGPGEATHKKLLGHDLYSRYAPGA